MEGIQQMFAEFSQPSDFDVQAQLELFAWARNRDQREQDAKRKADLVEYRRRHVERMRQDAERLEKHRAYKRQWMASKRAEQRAA